MRYCDKETILCALEQNAKRKPEKVALVFRDKKYTWRELHEITDRAASQLLREGVKREECVGMQITGGPGVIAILSIIKAGASYMPLNPVFPEERLTYMRDNAGVKRTLFEDDIEKLIRAEKGRLPREIIGRDRLAVIHTSGSTGTPKAINLFHRDAIPYTRYYLKIAGVCEEDSMAMYVGFSFVVHLMNLYVWIFSGANFHILSPEIKLDMRKIAEYFNDNSITAATFPMSIGKKLITTKETPALKTVELVGEKLAPFTFTGTDVRVFNSYGCTECASAVAIGEVFSGADVNVGKGVDGINLEIVDESGNPIPDGKEGELWVTLFDRLHKTGDLAKRNKDGNIEILGRKDFQLNVRGYRVEPGEIETCLLTFPGIDEAVAVMRSERLVAYYAAKVAAKPQMLRDHLSLHLPPYMIPSLFMRLDSLPRNANGKINRAKLPEPEWPKAGGEMPRSDTEKRLAEVWSDILGVGTENITRLSSFRELGGDSLSFIILAGEIDAKFNTTVTPAELQDAGTLIKQAQLIKNTKAFSHIFTFRAEGSRTPLFFAHSANTGPEAYVKFAGMLPENQPFYAFEHINLVRSTELGIRELAEVYADEMLKTCPQGPCMLGGWSLGGLISFEMALILEQKGFPIRHLYLIDPQICGDMEHEIYAELDSTPYYREYLENEPLFKRFRNDVRIEMLIRNNTFCAKEASSYKPRNLLNCPATLFRMTLPDSAEHASTRERALLTRLWELKKPDNGFGSFVKDLKIINIAETHDRVVTDEASLQAIVREIAQDIPASTIKISGGSI